MAGPDACRNCGGSLDAVPRPHYCPACGQATALHPPTVFEFVHEFVGHYVALEGALWRTLAALLLRPGRLTAEYFAGRRGRYIAPLRLYLSVSLLLFAAVAYTGGLRFGGESVQFAADASSTPGDRNVVLTPPRVRGFGWVERMEARLDAMTPAERAERVRTAMSKLLPYLLMVLVPVLALYKRLAYWNRRRRYAEHLVVAFHAQTVVFIFALVSALPLPGWSSLVMAPLLCWHGAVALRRVYGGRLLPTLLREGVIVVAYGATALVALVLLVFGSMLA